MKVYEKFIMQLCIYAKAFRILEKGHLPISLITPLRQQNIFDEVKTAVVKTNPDYYIVIKRLHVYYDMKLATFGIDKDKNLIVQFPVFIHLYIQQQQQQPLILYLLETVPLLIIDQNTEADTFTNRQTIHSS